MCILCESISLLCQDRDFFVRKSTVSKFKSFVLQNVITQIFDKLGASTLVHADLLTCSYANLSHLHSIRFVVRVRHTLPSLPNPLREKKPE